MAIDAGLLGWVNALGVRSGGVLWGYLAYTRQTDGRAHLTVTSPDGGHTPHDDACILSHTILYYNCTHPLSPSRYSMWEMEHCILRSKGRSKPRSNISACSCWRCRIRTPNGTCRLPSRSRDSKWCSTIRDIRAHRVLTYLPDLTSPLCILLHLIQQPLLLTLVYLVCEKLASRTCGQP